MPINSSTFTEGLAQKDGRKQVIETHVDHLGIRHVYSWFANAGVDPSPVMAARVNNLLDQLRDSEIEKNIALIKHDGSLAATTTNYSTANENFAVLRGMYKTATRLEAIMMGDFLAARTDAQLRNLFGYTQAQVDSLRTNKLTPAASAAATIRATTGV